MEFFRFILIIILCCCLLCGCSADFQVDDYDLTESTTGDMLRPEQDPYIHLSFFLSYAKDRNTEMTKKIIDELNALSTSTIGVYVDYIFTDNISLSYEQQLKMMLQSGSSTPDIFITYSLYGYYYSARDRDDLFHYASQNIAADLSDYLNEQTPYISAFYEQYPAFYEMAKINGRLSGIALPEDWIFNCPVLMVKKIYSREHYINPPADVYEALDVCNYISNVTEKTANIYVHSTIVMQALVDKDGYYSIYSDSPYIYLAKKGDEECNVFRMEQTDLLDQVTLMKNDLNQYNIKTYVIPESVMDTKPDVYLSPSITGFYSFFPDFDLDAILDEYEFYYLYNHKKSFQGTQLQFPYLVVSESCEEKQKAVQYIDWLHSNPQARKLIGYGIENVNYKFDHEKNFLYHDNTVTPVKLLNIGAGSFFALSSDRLSNDVNHILFVKNRLYENYELNDLTERLISNSDLLNYFHEESNKLRSDYRKQYSLENNFEDIKRRFKLSQIFDEDITIENVEQCRELLEESYNEEYLEAIKSLINSFR